MDFDFPMIMVVATAVTGFVYALDAALWAPKRRVEVERVKATAEGEVDEEKLAKAAKEPILVEYSRSLFPVILAVLVLRSFLVEPFRIPSGSMMPTLLVGDFILVNKFSYGLRLPVVNTRIADLGRPARGDVVVFRFPKDPTVDYIKRVVGLPGDRIAYRGKTLYVNGTAVKIALEGPYTGTKSGLPMPGIHVYKEDLVGVQHNILMEEHKPMFDVERVVPDGHYFVMGDNRDNSNDSRFWGFVPEGNLVGKAFMIWMHWNLDTGGIEWRRIGNSIH